MRCLARSPRSSLGPKPWRPSSCLPPPRSAVVAVFPLHPPRSEFSQRSPSGAVLARTDADGIGKRRGLGPSVSGTVPRSRAAGHPNQNDRKIRARPRKTGVGRWFGVRRVWGRPGGPYAPKGGSFTLVPFVDDSQDLVHPIANSGSFGTWLQAHISICDVFFFPTVTCKFGQSHLVHLIVQEATSAASAAPPRPPRPSCQSSKVHGHPACHQALRQVEW